MSSMEQASECKTCTQTQEESSCLWGETSSGLFSRKTKEYVRKLKALFDILGPDRSLPVVIEALASQTNRAYCYIYDDGARYGAIKEYGTSGDKFLWRIWNAPGKRPALLHDQDEEFIDALYDIFFPNRMICQHIDSKNNRDCYNYATCACMCCAVPMCDDHGGGRCKFGGGFFTELKDE